MKQSKAIYPSRLAIRSLTDILDIRDLQELQDSFAKANNVASSIVDLQGQPITEPSNHSQVCKLIRETKKGFENCACSGKKLGTLALETQKPYCHFCSSVGFIDAAAPIVVENNHLANWLIGQNCVGEVDEERILSYSAEIGADPDKMLQAFRQMEKISETEFKKKLDFLWIMANQISNQAYQHILYQTMLVSLEQSRNELNEYKDNLENIVNQRTVELENAIEKIQRIAIKDALTGCFNRGGIIKFLAKEMKRAKRYNHPIAVLLCDLDRFKKVNDTYGHQSGDIVLQKVVSCIEGCIRDDVDWLARYGGEEFLLVIPMTDIEGAFKLAERLRLAISELSFIFSEEKIQITASFGVCGIENWEDHSNISHEGLINCADVNLYRAKNEGRNRVVCSSPS
jgi:diguanylate cyclase (GGDEF)-like protein